jgi:hypothetical protein
MYRTSGPSSIDRTTWLSQILSKSVFDFIYRIFILFLSYFCPLAPFYLTLNSSPKGEGLKTVFFVPLLLWEKGVGN